MIEEDLQALTRVCGKGGFPGLAAAPEPGEDPSFWRQYFEHGAWGWKSAIAGATQCWTKEEYERQRTCPPPPVPIQQGAPHKCRHCHRIFGTQAQLISHQAIKHGYRSSLRLFAQDQHCLGCLKMFWQRERVLHHLKRSRCGPLAKSILAPLSLEQSLQLDEQAAHEARQNLAQGRGHRFAKEPCVQLQGPLCRDVCYRACKGETGQPMGVG